MTEIIPKLPVFFLVLIRLSAFFVTVPFFSYKTIPVKDRIFLAVVLAWIMSYTMEETVIKIDDAYAMLVLKEAVVGLSLGLLAYIIISAVQIAGSFIDFQIGFAIANIIDPMTGTQSPLIGQFFQTIVLLLLITTNAHYMLLDGIYYSYEYIPLQSVWPNFGDPAASTFIMKTFTAVFAIAFQMAIPVVATVFLVDLALGITAKTVPQLNIFVVGFPIKIGVSFIIMIVTMGVMVAVMQKLFRVMFEAMRDFMVILGGG
ncbi:MAG: flagellar biosynthetic protein FliR [Kurthia gibsonii]|uniref:Flagellar biosynthetic protein FliR n=1 Tax=Kurthia gibsonii TaxID=33946 RepID=A0ABU9LKX5_9BACL|nr:MULTISPECIES: flagellar biosynthetic protein FliR [Kurthia]AMA63130.1 flagellar biosynthetic protein FliR [Kurthia sp. 11kri321]MEB7771774.1 flagellar type III secretion system protein FliR [Kurthia gibsonii]RXH53031.1 flagellar type III secretion system protein FliR [Kurthia gibsonii]GED18784.1 flagellar biosynthetic protein FliR [Kurthia gibsonii]HZG12008.1 flagellar biosynthetic protein FliR [Kurthia gibsonii]